jgi:3-phenylpropionate/trans-cinnamate dioxygenase ferredoxin subunit
MYNYKALKPEECEFITIANVNDLPPGERLFIEIDQNSIVVFNLAGQYFAIDDVCSHDGGPVGDGELDGMEIVCPRHGARFDIRTGRVRSLPAVEDISAYPVRVVQDEIQIGLPIEQ